MPPISGFKFKIRGSSPYIISYFIEQEASLLSVSSFQNIAHLAWIPIAAVGRAWQLSNDRRPINNGSGKKRHTWAPRDRLDAQA